MRSKTPVPVRPCAASWVVALAFVPVALKLFSIALLPANYAAQSLYKLGQLLVPVLWRRNVHGKRGLTMLWPVDEPLPSPGTWLIAVVTALVSVGASILAVLLFAGPLGADPSSIREHLADKFSFHAATMIPVVIFLSTVNAGLEELHFRAWLDPEWSARWGAVTGILTSNLLFAATHLFIFYDAPGVTVAALLMLLLALTIGGVAWSCIARRPGGIHAAWLAHGLTDALLLSWGLYWLGMFDTK